MRRFSFNIDLRKKKSGSSSKSGSKKSTSRPAADGFEMSSALSQRRQFRSAWPEFQTRLDQLPQLIDTVEEWDDVNLAGEYLRIYNVSQEKVLDAAPGFSQQGKLESHCFFHPDGTKHFVSRLTTNPHHRVNEIRLSPDGQLVRLYYENTGQELQSLDDLFETGLLDLENQLQRFSRYPHYVMRFFLLIPEGELLHSTFRGICFYDPETHEVVTQEAESLSR